MIQDKARKKESRESDDSDGGDIGKNGNDSSATTSDGVLPLTNPVTVYLNERKEN